MNRNVRLARVSSGAHLRPGPGSRKPSRPSSFGPARPSVSTLRATRLSGADTASNPEEVAKRVSVTGVGRETGSSRPVTETRYVQTRCSCPPRSRPDDRTSLHDEVIDKTIAELDVRLAASRGSNPEAPAPFLLSSGSDQLNLLLSAALLLHSKS